MLEHDALFNSVQDAVTKKKKINLKYLLIVFAGPVLAGLILFILNLIWGKQTQAPWINQINLWIFMPLIFISLFYAQKNELVGAYGETILLLIPTFVWLLPGHYQAIELMIVISFILIIIGVISALIGFYITKMKVEQENEMKFIKSSVVAFRIGYVCIALVSTLIVSSLLIFWADYSMGYSKVWHTEYHYISPTNGQKGWYKDAPDGLTALLGQKEVFIKDYSSSRWITFVSTITIFVASGLVVLGLISTFSKNFEKTTGKKLGYNLHKIRYTREYLKKYFKKESWKKYWKYIFNKKK